MVDGLIYLLVGLGIGVIIPMLGMALVSIRRESRRIQMWESRISWIQRKARQEKDKRWTQADDIPPPRDWHR